jgi:TusA-related sulfurtransferase
MAEKMLIDARGSFCPGPLMELIAKLKSAQVGDEFEVLSSDKGSAKDIPEWVEKAGHEMVESRQDKGVWHITVRKKR